MDIILRVVRLGSFGDCEGVSLTLACLLLRSIVGVAFVRHGRAKAADIPGFMEEFGLTSIAALIATYGQQIAGVALVVGALTPFASLFLAATMGVAATQLIRRGEPFVNPHGHSWESSGFYFVANVVLFLIGPGRLSFDWLLFH